MTVYQRFRKMQIDHALIGLEQREEYDTYFCTPRDAEIIGWAGMDGIHYCTIPAFGEMIFAVNPTNFGDYVHPIAYSFEELLRLLLACSDMAALEQCHAWNEEQFKAFLTGCPVIEEQRAVLDAIRQEFCLEPMENAFAYVKRLQSEFDLSRIPYTGDCDDPDMNAAVPEKPAEWKVTYDGGFWSDAGNAGYEISVKKAFLWGSEQWYIPAVYVCEKGLVVDYLKEADPGVVKAFIEKWDLYNEAHNRYTKEQQEQIRREHPLIVGFHGEVTFHGQVLRRDHGCAITWLPASCMSADMCQEAEAQRVLEHYGLDLSRAWFMCRSTYHWGKANGSDMRALSVRMERCPEDISGAHFKTPAKGECIALSHPLTGKRCTLTVHEIEQKALGQDGWPDPAMEYPTHYKEMRYSLEPDLHDSGFQLQDCAECDCLRQRQHAPIALPGGATTIGIIGGADGPTSILLNHDTGKLHTVCSSLHFEPVEEVEWRAVFCEKMMEDISVELL